jgi:deoxyadenosine/deoxycytidine kinase
MPFPKIMEHPDKNRIVKWLRDGKGVRWVSRQLREMYPDDKSRQLSVPTLQSFRKAHLRLDGDALGDIKKAAREHANEKALSKEHTEVRNLPSYKQKLAEIVDLHIDIKKGLVAMEALITARLEELFDTLHQRREFSIDKEKLLQGYFDRYFIMIDKWAKYVEKVADFRVEANINVTVIQDQMAVMRQAVQELLQEMDPDMAISFLGRLNGKMRQLNYRTPSGPPSELALTCIRDQVAALPETGLECETDPEITDAD